MTTIFRVAKTELRTLFYSPIAWFLLIIFFIQCGSTYLFMLKHAARIQEFGGLQAKFLEMLTTKTFLGISGVFRTVMQNLYLYLPLITMGLISREMGSGTIKLLYSSPVKIREIILGKFLAMMIFNIFLLLIIATFIFSGLAHIIYPETGMLMTSILGFYLLLCAYSAIGLFMSTLTTYQVVAAISTFVMIGILSYIGQLWQRIELVRELTYFLSMPLRTRKMLQGLLTTKDVIYFLLIVYMFLAFSIFRLKGGMESKPWTVKALRYAGAVSIVFIIGYITSIPKLIGYYDATNGKVNTITPVVQKIIKEMADSTLEITSFANLVDETYMVDHPDSYNEIKERWEPYLRYNNNMKFNKISYYDSTLNNPLLFQQYPGKNLKEIADQHAKRFDMELKEYLTPEQIRKMVDLRPELNRYVMRVKWKGREQWLRVFNDDDGWPTGTEIAVVMKRLQNEKMPKIAFITGELERDIDKLQPREYNTLVNAPVVRFSLVNQGFDVTTVDLAMQDVPAGIDALVLADPKFDLQPAAKIRLMKYINEGGNLLITTEPGRQDIMNPLLKELGVQVMDGLLMQEQKYAAPDYTEQVITTHAASFNYVLEKGRKGEYRIVLPGASGLTWEDTGRFDIKTVLHTQVDKTWNRTRPFDPEIMTTSSVNPPKELAGNTSNDSTNRNKTLNLVTYSPADGDVMDTISSVVSLTRKINNKEQRIIISADADFISNVVVGNVPLNLVFSTGVFSWLTGGKFPIDSSRPEPLDNRVTVTVKQIERLRIIYIWVVPAVILVLGTILLIRRKRK